MRQGTNKLGGRGGAGREMRSCLESSPACPKKNPAKPDMPVIQEDACGTRTRTREHSASERNPELSPYV